VLHEVASTARGAERPRQSVRARGERRDSRKPALCTTRGKSAMRVVTLRRCAAVQAGAHDEFAVMLPPAEKTPCFVVEKIAKKSATRESGPINWFGQVICSTSRQVHPLTWGGVCARARRVCVCRVGAGSVVCGRCVGVGGVVWGVCVGGGWARGTRQGEDEHPATSGLLGWLPPTCRRASNARVYANTPTP